MNLSPEELTALAEGRVRDPFALLGLHRLDGDHQVVRTMPRDAAAVRVRRRDTGEIVEARRIGDSPVFAAVLDGSQRFAYDLLLRFAGDDREHAVVDPYACWPQLADFDLERFRDGRHHDLADILGAQVQTVDGVSGTRFSVWAPNAARVSVVGDWNGFDGRWHPMRPRDPFGVWELFIPGVGVGARYKFEIRAQSGVLRVKADPFARHAEEPPATASVVWQDGSHQWGDAAWLEARRSRDHLRRPMAIFECHLGSWMRGSGDATWPNYRDLAKPLIAHCRRFHFTHIEFLPLAQHPYEGSWGYQVTGQYAPNSRHGNPDDLRALIDALHQAGIGVFVDYVPGHFPKDDFSLARFDGTPCYEYGDPREGEHKTWGTMVFNYRRPEVRNFLLAAALHWLRSFHIDGLRVDAVSSMLYRDYDRSDGQWVANERGDNANLEAVSFLQELNTLVHHLVPGALTIAEESTAWKGVTAAPEHGGLGFDLKWNMGWMHDTLAYVAVDPVLRSGAHDRITFHQWYAYDDKWVLPLSHDEVVHGKKSLIDKPAGDWWQRRAQLRLLVGWQVAVPGRPLLFQGAEFGQGREWNWEAAPDQAEAGEPERQGLMRWLAAALACYAAEPALYRADDDRDGFMWVEADNRDESVVAFLRKAPGATDVLIACNFTPVPRTSYPLGVPQAGPWTVLLNSDDAIYGGSGAGSTGVLTAADHRRGVFAATIDLDLPPLGVLILRGPGAGRG